MKKGDFLWILVLGVIVYFILVVTNTYLVGFIKFFILATMGEILENRVMFAAILSIAFRVIVAYSKLRKSSKLEYNIS